MSALFKKALASLKESKNLDTALVGSSFLDEGTYQFTIQAVDISDLATRNKISVTYATPEGQQYTDNPFFANKDGTSIGQGIRMLLVGLGFGPADLGRLGEAMDADEHAIEALTGMKLQATLKRGPGFRVHSLASGGYAAFDGADNTAEQLTDSFDDVKDARDAAKAKGLKPSYVNVASMKATNAEDNLAAFAKALAATGKPKVRASKAI